jgi:hypothetical protein
MAQCFHLYPDPARTSSALMLTHLAMCDVDFRLQLGYVLLPESAIMEELYAFEKLDVYHAANQLARVVGAICVSLPGKKDRIARKMIRANVLLGITIAGGNLETATDQDLTIEERRKCIRTGQNTTREMRRLFLDLKRERLGSQSHIGAGLELLERIDRGLADNLEQLRPGFDPREYARLQQRITG